jgi:1-acyl-sn-glycerol-3-phosphate acyltransferase
LWILPQGASVLFFPEGTRSKDGKMASFKKVRPPPRLSALQGLMLYASSSWLAPRCALLASALLKHKLRSHTNSQGAFSVAVKTGSPVVPITLVGTGKLMPNGQESRLYGGRGVKIIVHPRIQVQSAAGCMQMRQATAPTRCWGVPLHRL